jgi:peptidoglycan/xylan/chitin deacetylase (PgdA/CDA1 family)
MLSDRPPVQWPGGARLALWVNVCLQFFPLDQRGEPFAPPGGMTMPYPDLRHYTLRDYGNRVGIFRILKALDRFRVTPTFAVNTRLLERYPYLGGVLRERGEEILCHGWHMDAIHHGGEAAGAEEARIGRAVEGLRALTGQPVRGWLSPARNESPQTPELLAGAGIEYFCDWVNDDMPYRFHTAAGDLWAMPLSNELEDRFILVDNLHSEASYEEQICDACDLLLAEAQREGGRILALNLHPWLLGQPHRIGRLEAILDYVMRQEGVWSAPAGAILDAFRETTAGAA